MTNRRWPVAEAAGLTESVIGAGGRRLDEACQNGAEAYLGITVTGCPNVFPLDRPNTKLGGNSIIYMLQRQIPYVASALPALREQRQAWVDVSDFTLTPGRLAAPCAAGLAGT